MNYFENIYLGNANNKKAISASKTLQKLLSKKAIRNAKDSSKLTVSDYKNLQPKKMHNAKIAEIDFDNYIRPYEVI